MHSTQNRYFSLDEASKLDRGLITFFTHVWEKGMGFKFNSVKVMEFPKTWSG